MTPDTPGFESFRDCVRLQTSSPPPWGMRILDSKALAIAIGLSCTGCYTGLADSDQAVLTARDVQITGDPEGGLLVQALAGDHEMRLRTLRGEEDAEGLSIVPQLMTGDDEAITAAWLSSLDEASAQQWDRALQEVATILAEAELQDVDLELDRHTLLAALDRVTDTSQDDVGFRNISQDISYRGFSDYPFVEYFSFYHPGDGICAQWWMQQSVVYEWANPQNAFISWHGTTYYVLDGTINAGLLHGYGGPKFFQSDWNESDYGWTYSYEHWGETRWEWIGKTVNLPEFNNHVIFEKHYWTGGCDGGDQAITVFQ